MRGARRAVITALLLAAGSLPSTMAHAAAGSTIYVDDAAGAGCSASAAGTQANPFCGIQSAVNVATAGDTVLVEPGAYQESVTVTQSGNASAPISIVGSGGVQTLEAHDIEVGAHVPGPAFTISGASYVDISGFDAMSGSVALVENSSHITLDTMWQDGSWVDPGVEVTTPAVHLAGSSSYVTVSRNYLYASGQTAAVQVDPGGSHDVLTTNALLGESGGFAVDDAPDTDVTGNTVETACNEGIELTGASTGSIIENNAVAQIQNKSTNQNCPPSTAGREQVEVDGAATAGTKLDYNTLYPPSPGVVSYVWDGTDYSSPSALLAATGQGAHDLSADPLTNPVIKANSPLVDSADANAPGELSTDLWGNPRVDDPDVPDTGAGSVAYYDRGAMEFEDPLTPAVSLNSAISTAPATVTADESLATPGWSAADSWTVDFGDGTPATTTSSVSDASHTYTKPGAYTITVTAKDATTSKSVQQTEQVLSSSVYHPTIPVRILDTRKGTGTGGAVAQLKAGGSLALKITNNVPVPDTEVTAVALNVTVTDSTGGGYISAYADGSSRPITSNINFAPGRTQAGQVIAPVGADGKIDLYYGGGPGATDLVADVTGYFGAGAGSGFQPLGEPTRILDTRSGIGGGTKTPIAANGSFKLTAANTDGLLVPGQTVALNVTATGPKGSGYLIVYPGGTDTPGTSNLNFAAGQTVANQVLTQVGSDGSIEFRNVGTGSVNVVADLLGVFSTRGGDGYVPVQPIRLLDTRNGTGAPKAPVGANATTQATVRGAPGVPADADAVAANITVTQPTLGGDLVAYPQYLDSVPQSSTLNFTAGQTVANAALMNTTYNGIKLLNQSAGSIELVVDVFGYFEP